MAEYALVLAGLIELTVLVSELLKKLSGANRPGKFVCRACGRQMQELPFNWATRLPFEVWATVARYNLKPQSVRRFICPQKHTISWYLPKFGERECEVLVSKSLTK